MDPRIEKKDPWGYVEFFEQRLQAIDYALWMNFKYRRAQIKSGVFENPQGKWSVCEEATRIDLDQHFTESLPESYQNLSFDELDILLKENHLLLHWEQIRGMISVMDGEILRYILATKIPLDKLIRIELANRGFDTDNLWCGFEKAKEIWLNSE